MDSIFVGEQGLFLRIVFWSVIGILTIQFSWLVADIIKDAFKNRGKDKQHLDELSS